MSLVKLTEKLIPEIEVELQNVVRIAFETGLEDYHSMLAYHMGWEGERVNPEARGKRIRPLLVLLVTAAGGGDWQKALPAAAAVELVHNFSLIHDDIQDQSQMRRGRETVWKRWGIAQALNTGDAMFTLAHMSIFSLQATTSPIVAMRASQLLHETCLELTQGQYLDIANESNEHIEYEAYWSTNNKKTAALFATCAALGAMVAKTDKRKKVAYTRYAKQLGLAFQVYDDILGIWGDDRIMGKSSTSDLIFQKKSLPIIYALKNSHEFSQRWIGRQIGLEEIPDLIGLLEEVGARDYALGEARDLTFQALTALKQAEPSGQAGLALEELATQLLSRNI